MNSKIEINDYDFESKAYKILPGAAEYYCETHDREFSDGSHFYTDVGTIKDNVQVKDIAVEENRFFKYRVLSPGGIEKNRRVIFLFHGFNEKDWKKYMPWAELMCLGTGASVVLFPIAFHMQRAPKYWSSKREMFKLSTRRKERFPNIVNSTLSNVAISMRLHSMPQRFIWSGLQTFYDVTAFISDCKHGNHPHIEADFTFNIFAYSIGGFLAQILKLTNPEHYFTDTRVCLFCSGAAFNRLSPVSKFILDSEANVALYSFLVEHFDKMLEKDRMLNHYINEGHQEGRVFYSMLDYQKERAFREKLLKENEDHIYAITLGKDSVIPSYEVINTQKGAYRDINIRVDEIDFDREYKHENPFPEDTDREGQVREEMESVFKKVCDFFNKG